MDKDLITEIARQIITQQILITWQYYAIVVAVIIVGGGLAAYAGAFLAKRGESLAAVAGFDELKRQLEATTILTKRIETSLAHGDWVKREFRTLRRTKLEELMQGIYDTERWGEEQRMAPYPEGYTDTPSPFGHVSMLGLLYFPELNKELELFREAHGKLVIWSLTVRGQSMRLNNAAGVASSRMKRGGAEAIAGSAEQAAIYAEQRSMIEAETKNFFTLLKIIISLRQHIEVAAKKLMHDTIVAEERMVDVP